RLDSIRKHSRDEHGRTGHSALLPMRGGRADRCPGGAFVLTVPGGVARSVVRLAGARHRREHCAPHRTNPARSMTGLAARVVEHIHGHLGWLAVAALVHPAVLLGRIQRRAMLAAASATAVSTGTGLLGAIMYPEYRRTIKPALFAGAPALGWAF